MQFEWDMPATEEQDARPMAERLKELWASHQFRKLMRYSAVSLLFVPVGQALVQFLHLVLNWNEVVSVLVTACVLTPPNYYSNKHYVWRHKVKDNMVTEIVVFWVAAVLGTTFAMGLVYVAGQWFPESKGELPHSIAIFFAQLLGYGIVWVARFIFLDKLIFKATHHGEELPDVRTGEQPALVDPRA